MIPLLGANAEKDAMSIEPFGIREVVATSGSRISYGATSQAEDAEKSSSLQGWSMAYWLRGRRKYWFVRDMRKSPSHGAFYYLLYS